MLLILLNLLLGLLFTEPLHFGYHFELDAAGHVVREQGFDREYRSYQRDRAGRVIRETLPSGKFKEYEYDKCDRVTRITHDYDKVEEQTYSYYSSGRLQEAKNEHALVSFRYNNMGLPVEERCNEHKILRTYDRLGQISTLTSSLGANLTYERNEFGELLNFKARQGEAENHFVSEHQYDSLGFELERMLPGGISQSFAYDNIGRLVDSKTRQSSKVCRERKYHWGKADHLLKTEDSRYGTTSYEYSPTGHLQKATYADGTEEYRLSDKVGNLFDDPDRKLRKYLQGGKIEQSGEWRFKYDKDGQLTEKYKGSGKELYRVVGSVGKVIIEVFFDVPYVVTTILASVGFQSLLKQKSRSRFAGQGGRQRGSGDKASHTGCNKVKGVERDTNEGIGDRDGTR